MSPKQIWTQFGPRILGEPDITRNDAGEIQIRGSSLEAFAGSFQQAEAAMESPDGLGPMMPEYNGKPAEGLARLRQAKTGAVPALFHHKKYGDIGIMYGKPGDPTESTQVATVCHTSMPSTRGRLIRSNGFLTLQRLMMPV